MITIYVLNSTTNSNRIGIAVSKKFSKSSVKRNRVKRLIKETYRLNEDKIKLGVSIVILWKNNISYEKVTFENIATDLKKCFRKAGLIKEEEECDA